MASAVSAGRRRIEHEKAAIIAVVIQTVHLPSGQTFLTRGTGRGTGALTKLGLRSVHGRWRATAA